MNTVNISGYKFLPLTKLPTLREQLEHQAQKRGILGTILLSEEGINIMLAGPRLAIDDFIAHLHQDDRFSDIIFKESLSEDIPFEKLKVRIKPEIITMGDHTIEPAEETGKHLSPARFKAWLDEGRDLTILDTRNTYEIEFGTFDNAIDLNIENFRDFPEASKQLDPACKEKPLVMFCTGGVRCEKASVVLMRQGYKEVYQIEGGILKYFEDCGADHYHGHCFVFDDRIALDPNLNVVS